MTDTTATDTRRHGIYTPGAFVWHELLTRDVEKAQQFYTQLLGWTVTASHAPGMDYRLIHVGDRQIGGIIDLNAICDVPGLDIPPHWLGYVSVPDVDKAAEAAKAAGGQVTAGPMDIPNVGRFATVIDPDGAVLNVFRDAKGDAETAMPLAGEFCWDQLTIPDLDAAAAFYQQVVGWTMESPSPELGVFKSGDLMEASLMVAPAGMHPHWLTYIHTPDLVAATRKAEALGAIVILADMEGGDWGRFSLIEDPTGAHVALFRGNED